MKKLLKNNLVLSFLFVVCLNPVAGQQNHEITLDLIYKGWAFYPKSVRGIHSMNDGQHFTILEGGSKIVKFAYRSGNQEEIIFDASSLTDFSVKIESYSFSRDEQKILLQTQSEAIYRHSYRAEYYIYDRPSRKIASLSENGKQQLATFSPNGNKVAFVRENNLFYVDLISEKEIQVTRDGKRNEIINGAPDWVYEEEFGFSKGFVWSPKSDMLAFYRFDESRVRMFNMTMYHDLYPEWYQFKYPKAGEENSLVEIYTYHLETQKKVKVDIGPESDQYIPRIKWANANDMLAVIRLNRLQNKVEVLLADATTGKSSVVYEESNAFYISEVSDDFVTFTPDGKEFFVMSERSGYMHFYRYDINGNFLNAITEGDFDVAGLTGYDPEKNTLFYGSHERSPLQTDVYSIQIDGKRKKLLTPQKGQHSLSFSKGFTFYIDKYSNANSPPVITLYNSKGKQIRVLEDNSALKERMKIFGFSPKEFFTIPTPHDFDLNAFMIKPPNFDSNKNYPVLMYVYGGPESQLVKESYSIRDAWFQMLAQKGYIVVCADNRGTDARGEKFRKATYLNLGKYETEDQITAAKYLGSLDYIDADRIGVFGWSYGGYMSLLCLTKGAPWFKMGIAVAPVTNWRYYDTIYTERFMRKPQDNPGGYDDNSPINHVELLKGKLLLIHGMGDDNVHFQNSVELSEKLVQANKQFEMQFYPNKSHGIFGGNTTYHLYSRMTRFIEENL